MLARQATVSVNYEGIDITDDIKSDLLSFSYTDNASGNADDISLSLKDNQRKWVKDWFPSKGDIITPQIETVNWRRNGDKQILPCGHFFVDEPEYSGRPSVLTIGAISSPLNSNFSDVRRSKTWRNITIKEIAKDIADRAGLSLEFIGENNPLQVTIEQTETSDSSFLYELCQDEGLAMKVTDRKIVIFNEQEFEKRESIDVIYEWESSTLSYSFNSSLSNTAYDGVNVKYYDTNLGRIISFLYSQGEINDKSKIYQVNQKVSSGHDAKRLAKNTLRSLNKREVTANLSVIGNVEYLGGVCVDIDGFGGFDGKYFIEKATHSMGNGYQTRLEARKVLEGD